MKKKKEKKLIARTPVEMILRTGTFWYMSKSKQNSKYACRRKGKNNPLGE